MLCSITGEGSIPSEQQCAGVVHHDKLYLTMHSPVQDPSDMMRVFEPTKQEWTVLSLNVWPTACTEQLLVGNDTFLIQYGGMLTASTASCIWQQGAAGLLGLAG